MKRLVLMFIVPLFFVSALYPNQNTLDYDAYPVQENSFFDSLNVKFLGSWPFGQSDEVAYDMARNLVFLSSGAGVYILDSSDPSNPIKISELIHSREFIHQELFYDLSTQRLYVAVGRWFEIWDISNPYQPVNICTFTASGPPYGGLDICASGTFVYCLDNEGFYIFDVTDPSNPQLIGSCNTAGEGMAVSGPYAYVISSGNNGFHVIDISNPAAPQEVASLWQRGRDISVFGNYAYLSGDFGLYFRIIDISDPFNPQFAGYYDSPTYVFQSHVIGTIAYLATDSGLRIVDISDPMNSQELGILPGRARDVFVMDTVAYFVERDTGLRIIDVSSPSSPQEITTFLTPGKSYEVEISGAFAYIANEKGLWIVDISIPSNAKQTGYCPTPSKAFDVSICGMHAYIADRDSGLRVIDISDPANPHEIGFLDLPGWHTFYHYGLDVEGHYAYVADGHYGFYVIDISDPNAPVETGHCTFSTSLYSVDVSGLYAYVAGENKFSVVDISDPYNPFEVGYSYALDDPVEVFVSGLHAFVADSMHQGLIVFDIAQPDSPQVVANANASPASGVHISGQFAYVSNTIGRLEIFDVSQPSNPSYVGYYQTDWFNLIFHGISASGTKVYVASHCGLQIYEFFAAAIQENEKPPHYPTNLKLLQNPVKGNYIELILTAPESSEAEIALYNQIGQRLRTYQLNGLKSGENRLRLDANGLPNGVYFLKLSGKPVGKVVKVR